MVNESSDDAAAAERALALNYVPAAARAAVAALFDLDARLRAITRAAREPMIGLMRLTWWREALERLDAAPPPAEPLLRALAAEVLPREVSGAALAALTEGWERMLAGEVDWTAVSVERGRVFGLAARAAGADDARINAVGAAWALIDLARDWPADTPDTAVLDNAYRRPWPRALRGIGALGLLARSDGRGGTPGSPARVARLLAHRLSGR